MTTATQDTIERLLIILLLGIAVSFGYMVGADQATRMYREHIENEEQRREQRLKMIFGDVIPCDTDTDCAEKNGGDGSPSGGVTFSS